MKKIFLLSLMLLLLLTCNKKEKKNNDVVKEDNQTTQNFIKKDKNTIRERFSPPKDFEWIVEKPDSFGYFIENFPLKKHGSPILK